MWAHNWSHEPVILHFNVLSNYIDSAFQYDPLANLYPFLFLIEGGATKQHYHESCIKMFHTCKSAVIPCRPTYICTLQRFLQNSHHLLLKGHLIHTLWPAANPENQCSCLKWWKQNKYSPWHHTASSHVKEISPYRAIVITNFPYFQSCIM